MTEARFIRRIAIVHLAVFAGNNDIAKSYYDSILKAFPTKKNEINTYCFEYDFGKLGDEYTSYEDFYKQLIQ